MRNKFFVIGFLILISCGDNGTKIIAYYDTGEKKATIDKDSIMTEYYKNSKIKGFGKLSNNIKNGFWIDYYPDGSIKWQGNYINNKREIILVDTVVKISTRDHKQYFTIGESNYIRVIINNISPQDLLVTCNNGLVRLSDDRNYDYEICPKRKEKLYLTFLTVIDDQKRTIKRMGFDVK